MLADNIKALRKQKGYSQETLAQQLNVVRQTVSKWEKGLSVPDAEMLTRMAELFEVPVSTLLDSQQPEPDQPDSTAEVARQLAILNEHFARQTARRKKIWKIVGLTLLGVVLLYALLVGLFGFVRTEVDTYDAVNKVGMWCYLEDREYYYEVEFDEQYRISTAGGNSWVADHVMTEQYSDARVLMAQIEDYFTDRGGSVEFVGDVP